MKRKLVTGKAECVFTIDEINIWSKFYVYKSVYGNKYLAIIVEESSMFFIDKAGTKYMGYKDRKLKDLIQQNWEGEWYQFDTFQETTNFLFENDKKETK